MSRYLADPDFEPRIADWLDADPDLAPAPVLATVQAAFPSIPQRRATRAPRRLQTMNRFALLGAAAALILGLGLGGALLAGGTPRPSPGLSPSPLASASPSPSPSPLASASPAASRSPSPGVSDRLGPLGRRTTADDVGISIAYPGSWTEVVRPTSRHSVGVQLGVPGQIKEVMLNADWLRLPPGQTADDWIAERSVVVDNEVACRPEPANAEIQIGGHPGTLIDEGCGILGGRLHFLAVVVVGERGYTFHMDSKILGLAAFRTLLANVILDPTAGA